MASQKYSGSFTTTGTLGPFEVGQDPTQGGVVYPDDTVEELIAFQVDGTWNSATAIFYLCNDLDKSPQVWTKMVGGSFTADAADVIRLPTGAAFKLVITDTASPQGAISLYACVRGQIKTAGAT